MSGGSGASDALVAHVLSIDGREFEGDVRAAALRFLHDTLAVGIAGCRAPHADAVLALARGWSGAAAPGCGVLGRPGVRATAPYAAFVNAFQIHAQEFDCVHEPAVAHPLATVLSALLAQAQRGPAASGADFLAALVGGVDTVAALGTAATSPLRFFRPATCGVFGSVAALCRLRGLDAATSVHAFGHALSFASGTMQAHLEGRPTLALQVAGAARSAVEAVDLAACGLPAPAASIDGPYGYLALFEERHDLGRALARLGAPHAVVELSAKPFPTGRAAHGGIVAIQALVREHGVAAEAVEGLVYHAPPLIARLVGRAAFAGMGVAHARLCLPWLGAVTLRRGTVGLGDFGAAPLADPATLALAERIEVRADGHPDPAAFGPARLVATLRDGRTIEVPVERQLGSPAAPLDEAAHRQKVRECLAFGGLAAFDTALAAAVETLDAAPDAAAALSAAFGEPPAVTDPSAAFGSALVQAGVCALAERFADGTASPIDAVHTCLDRIDRIDRHDLSLHAFVGLDASGAAAAAAASAARWAAGRPLSPIDGVPLAVKANIALRGLPWTGGLAARRDRLATDDAACTARLLAAGAVLLGTLAMDEAALGATGDNPWYGRTLNPHGAGLSPGGSSAGAAAAVAAGLCAAAVGTDTMGSVRIPAACCGVVGWSPRRGTVAAGGVLPLSPSFDNVGVLARSLNDARALLDAMAGRADSAPPGDDLAVLTVPGNIELAPAVRQGLDAACAAARAAGARLHPWPLDGLDLRRLCKALLLVVEVEAGLEHAASWQSPPETLSEGLRGLLDWGARQTAAKLGQALRDLRDAGTALRARLVDAGPGAGLLLPVVPRAAFGFDEPQPLVAVFTALGSIAGLSGLSLPMALAGEAVPGSVPGSVQILAADNATTFGWAQRLARHLPPAPVPAGFSR